MPIPILEKILRTIGVYVLILLLFRVVGKLDMAALSTFDFVVRLYAGVPPKQVAQWAGHSVEVLQRVYSKILDGFDDTWFGKIDIVLGNSRREEPV